MKKIFNKRGVFSSFALVIIIVFIFAIIMFVTSNIWINMFTSITATGSFEGYAVSEGIMSDTNNAINLFDMLFVLAFCLLGLGIVLTAFFIDAHPIFLGVGLLMLLGMTLLCIILSNVFDQFSSNVAFNGQVAAYPMTVFVMDHYPTFILVFIALALIAFFGKAQVGR